MQADITCDSDGVLNHFISTRDAVDFDPILPLHELRTTEPYPLAMFLTGEAVGHNHRPIMTDALTRAVETLRCRVMMP